LRAWLQVDEAHRRQALARAEDAGLSAAVHQVIGNALARKLVAANQRRAPRVAQPA